MRDVFSVFLFTFLVALSLSACKMATAKEDQESFQSLLNNLKTSFTNMPAPEHEPHVTEQNGKDSAQIIVSSLAQCIKLPTSDKSNGKFEFRVELNSDGTVENIGINSDKERYVNDDEYRAAADKLMQSLYKCSPYSVPKDKYDTWKAMNLVLIY